MRNIGCDVMEFTKSTRWISTKRSFKGTVMYSFFHQVDVSAEGLLQIVSQGPCVNQGIGIIVEMIDKVNIGIGASFTTCHGTEYI